jgi:hypothetical protein
MRAGREIRITFALGEDKEGARAVVLHNVGHHDPTLRPPERTDLSPDRVALNERPGFCFVPESSNHTRCLVSTPKDMLRSREMSERPGSRTTPTQTPRPAAAKWLGMILSTTVACNAALWCALGRISFSTLPCLAHRHIHTLHLHSRKDN